jgi:hypothetical protein
VAGIEEWLLTTFWDMGQTILQKWRVPLTDEDTAFSPAMECVRRITGFPGDFEHHLCELHTKKNFVSKVQYTGLSEREKELHSDRLNKCMESSTVPELGQFARAFMGKQFSCDVSATFGAESMDHMLKKGVTNRQRSLVEARRHFTSRLENHQREIDLRRATSAPCKQLFCEVETQFLPSANQNILSQLEKVHECDVEEIE